MLIKQGTKKNAALWSVTSWSMVDIYQRLAGPLKCQQISTRINSITSKNTIFFVITAVKTQMS